MGATSLDFVPRFSFTDYDADIGSPPDLIVSPLRRSWRSEPVWASLYRT
jgi:hypothetical protein